MHPLSAVMFLALIFTSCGDGGTADDPYSPAAAGLCEATAETQAGNGDEARRLFYDIVHQPLHDLAAEIAQVDRTLAARLLEAKESVEFALDNDRAALAESFQVLVGAADAAMAATGHNPVPCLATST